MSRSLLLDLKTLAKNLFKHLRYVLNRRESVRCALSGMVSDVKKLRVHVGAQHATERRKVALKYVKQGRTAYNAKNDALAEKLFREAVAADETCALAYAYLGNALYRQGQTDEAEVSWRRATMIDPSSEGAEKALHSLQHLARKKKAYMDHLDDKLRHGRSS
ncbi:MAG TPA: tetratricopeptide repeat protein [Candidatus Hydrogenedentes bacterium]|nr:tetratricopeptide repeat protein [Candidatus Hydrogenedentota bacterium]